MPSATRDVPGETCPAPVSGLGAFCGVRAFAPGERLRVTGEHYTDMYWIAAGEVEVALAAGGTTGRPMIVGPGSPIGEIGFLRGTPANAAVTARSDVRALVIDDGVLARIEARAPDVAARLMQELARTAEDRTSFNLTLGPGAAGDRAEPALDIRLCRNAGMLGAAQRLRYEVYCGELGRSSPSACPDAQTIADPLDDFGHCFVALDGGEVVATLRANFAREGALGSIAQLYGMDNSRHHPDATGICTKFIVRRSHRGGAAAMRLIARQVQYGLRHGMRECYIDTVPSLVDYYRALGFEVSGEEFFHRENGPSLPMRLDLVAHGPQMAGEAGLRRMMRLFVKMRAREKRADNLEAGS